MRSCKCSFCKTKFYVDSNDTLKTRHKRLDKLFKIKKIKMNMTDIFFTPCHDCYYKYLKAPKSILLEKGLGLI
ncbi:MAG: hypothetical protein CMC55_08740 [Flavobacteriaceae bacterium]|nr:hypothetical protein [Flavobacteriaceae bacterium]|tara:strand:+ start:744 stop:962 length:219 start_codon:yes stop_codon:yes gene_type:complete